MGVLDDAIREHLDLKRRRGADPAEVERAEQEALGPVRRGPLAAEPPELVLDEEHQPSAWEQDYTDEHEVAGAAEPDGGVGYPEPHAPLEPRPAVGPELFDDEDDPFGDQGPAEPEAPLPVAQRSPEPDYLDEPERVDEPAPRTDPAPPPHPASPPRDQLGETVEYDLEEALGEGGGATEEHARPPAAKQPAEGADEDPLEETPEFLQETPDHDRLWFEQRPPRDFDFDG